MKSKLFYHYLHKFSKLNRASKNGVKAPHKPILLLALIQSISIGDIRDNKIYITPQLVANFKDHWNWLVKGNVFTPNFSLPFFHMRSEKFWHLQTSLGKEILLTSSNSIKSFSQLREALEFAFLDEALFELLMNSDIRIAFTNFLFEHYFHQTAYIQKTTDLFQVVEQQILHDTRKEYIHAIEAADEEEVFVRSGVFKKLVPRVYDLTCCISNMRIVSGYDIQMVDACHIIPFSRSHDDTITNGITLCPNLHRAFDRGLITIDNEFKVQVTNNFLENTSDFSLKKYQGKSILLPKQQAYFPSVLNLEWHKINVFRN